MIQSKTFREWIQTLDEDVIQGEFGYERGEFTIYTSHWYPLFKEGLTPREAWQRALDGFAAQRKADDEGEIANYARIVAEDQKYGTGNKRYPREEDCEDNGLGRLDGEKTMKIDPEIVERLAKIIDPEAFGLPNNIEEGTITDRDEARDRVRLVLRELYDLPR